MESVQRCSSEKEFSLAQGAAFPGRAGRRQRPSSSSAESLGHKGSRRTLPSARPTGIPAPPEVQKEETEALRSQTQGRSASGTRAPGPVHTNKNAEAATSLPPFFSGTLGHPEPPSCGWAEMG